MSQVLLSIPCTLLKTGFSFIPKKLVNCSGHPTPEESKHLYLEALEDDSYSNYTDYIGRNDDVLYVYDPITGKEEDWNEWNIKEDGTNIEDVLTKPALLIFKPEDFINGEISPERYSPAEYLAEGSFDEVKDMGELLFEEIFKRLAPRYLKYDNDSGLMFLEPAPAPIRSEIERSYVEFRFLTEFDWWSHHINTPDCNEWDSGLDFVKFVDI